MQILRSRRRLSRGNGNSKIVLASKISTYVLYGIIGLVILMVIVFVWFSRDLPTPGKLTQVQDQQSTRIYDRNNVLLYSVYKTQNRSYVKLPDIPKNLQNATISIEDKTFYQDAGFSPLAYLRVLKDIVLHARITGGSGLTQQLVSNTLISKDYSVARKIKELILAIQVNQRYSKDQILEMYLNAVPYGGPNVGVDAASQAYFSKPVNQLDLAQCALLAGLPQAPSLYYPYNGNKYYIGRSKDVLSSMVNNGFISQKQADDANKEIQAMVFSQKDESIKAPWWVMYIKELAAKQFGDAMVENGGLQIYTTLDYTTEQKAEDIVSSEIAGLKSYHVGNGAAIVSDPKTGEILAMVGNTDYYDTTISGNFNDAVDAHRQPGSSLKPFLYATAFMKGYTLATEVMDVQTDFPSNDPKNPIYAPVNYSGQFQGPIQLRFALGNSLNIPAVKMLARVGIKDFMTTAYNAGITNWQPTDQNISSVGLSLVLGGRETNLLDETTAYGALATGGIRHDPVAILKVKDSGGNTIFQNTPSVGTRVLPADVAFLVSHILLDNNARTLDFGPNSWLVVPGKTVSVKTGTTDDKRDNYTIGYTPSYVVSVWVGNNDNTPMNQKISSGETGASPIWNKIMTYVLKGKSDEPPQKPDDVIATQVDSLFGGLPINGQPTRSEYFIKGTEPTTQSSVYQKKDDKTYYVVREDDPVSTDGINRWQIGIDAWIHSHHSAADAQWYPPDDLLKSLNITNAPTPTPKP